MATEKRLIDANALIEEINQQRRASRTSFPRRSYVVGDVLTSIYNAPTVDAVEVVRCMDCKHWKRCYKMTKPNELSPCGSCGLISMDVYMNEGDFCSYGERRANG